MTKGWHLWILAVLLMLLALLGLRQFKFGADGTNQRANKLPGSADSSATSAGDVEDPSAMKPAKRPRKPPEDEGGNGFIRAKMKEIIIPIIDFEDTSLEEAVDFLRLRSRELDPDPDPNMRGLGFRIRKPQQENGEDGDARAGLGPTADPGVLRIKRLQLKNVSLWQALHRIADECGLKVEITEYAIELRPK